MYICVQFSNSENEYGDVNPDGKREHGASKKFQGACSIMTSTIMSKSGLWEAIR